MSDQNLQHFGVLGMRWGRRRGGAGSSPVSKKSKPRLDEDFTILSDKELDRVLKTHTSFKDFKEKGKKLSPKVVDDPRSLYLLKDSELDDAIKKYSSLKSYLNDIKDGPEMKQGLSTVGKKQKERGKQLANAAILAGIGAALIADMAKEKRKSPSERVISGRFK